MGYQWYVSRYTIFVDFRLLGKTERITLSRKFFAELKEDDS